MAVIALLAVVCVVLVAGLFVMWRFARRVEDDMSFDQAEGIAKADDGLRLGIALSSNAQSSGF